jgi:hypothetical protein
VGIGVAGALSRLAVEMSFINSVHRLRLPLPLRGCALDLKDSP